MDKATLKKVKELLLKQKQNKGMTKQEAIEQMCSMMAHARAMLKNTPESVTWKKDIEAIAIGKTAILKQIGLTPVVKMNEKSIVFIEYEDGHGESKEKTEDIYCCPRCLEKLTNLLIITGKQVPSHKVRYCEKCGQKIDWSREGIFSK